MDQKLWNINFCNANSRETYYTIHNVKAAHKYGRGKDVRVGIIDWLFGLDEHNDLYSGGVDLSGNADCSYKNSGHGYWMACALKEIAPECRIFAINFLNGENVNERAEYIVKAVDWAIENGIDILTYSHSRFNNDERAVIDKAVDKAYAKGVTTTFIHYDYEKNIFPGGLFKFREGVRDYDIRILHYDYNTLSVDKYEKYIAMNKTDIKSGDDVPYFSISSMSPVLAGFVAILKSVNRSLTADDCKKILKETSYSTHFTGYAPFDDVDIDNVADIGKATKLTYDGLLAGGK